MRQHELTVFNGGVSIPRSPFTGSQSINVFITPLRMAFSTRQVGRVRYRVVVLLKFVDILWECSLVVPRRRFRFKQMTAGIISAKTYAY